MSQGDEVGPGKNVDSHTQLLRIHARVEDRHIEYTGQVSHFTYKNKNTTHYPSNEVKYELQSHSSGNSDRKQDLLMDRAVKSCLKFDIDHHTLSLVQYLHGPGTRILKSRSSSRSWDVDRTWMVWINSFSTDRCSDWKMKSSCKTYDRSFRVRPRCSSTQLSHLGTMVFDNRPHLDIPFALGTSRIKASARCILYHFSFTMYQYSSIYNIS